jgi:hypothetical protein
VVGAAAAILRELTLDASRDYQKVEQLTGSTMS